MGCGSIAPRILNFGISWQWMDIATPRPPQFRPVEWISLLVVLRWRCRKSVVGATNLRTGQTVNSMRQTSSWEAVFRLVKKFTRFIASAGSTPFSQHPTNCLHSQAGGSSPFKLSFGNCCLYSLVLPFFSFIQTFLPKLSVHFCCHKSLSIARKLWATDRQSVSVYTHVARIFARVSRRMVPKAANSSLPSSQKSFPGSYPEQNVHHISMRSSLILSSHLHRCLTN